MLVVSTAVSAWPSPSGRPPAALGGPPGRPALRDRAARPSAAGLRILRSRRIGSTTLGRRPDLVRAHRRPVARLAEGRRPAGPGPRRPSTSPTAWWPIWPTWPGRPGSGPPWSPSRWPRAPAATRRCRRRGLRAARGHRAPGRAGGGVPGRPAWPPPAHRRLYRRAGSADAGGRGPAPGRVAPPVLRKLTDAIGHHGAMRGIDRAIGAEGRGGWAEQGRVDDHRRAPHPGGGRREEHHRPGHHGPTPARRRGGGGPHRERGPAGRGGLPAPPGGPRRDAARPRRASRCSSGWAGSGARPTFRCCSSPPAATSTTACAVWPWAATTT